MSETEGRKPGLEEARKEIDRIDREMAALYQRRMETVEAVADWKKRHDLPVFQPEREAAILEKDAAWVKPAYRDSWVQLLKTMMAQSRAHQQRRICRDVVACQGMEGAFSHMAARGRFPDAMLQSHPTFEAVIQAVLGGSAQYGVIPFENTNSGLVGEVLDLLAQYPVYIREVLDVPVEQCLLGTPDATLKDIQWVYSKDQALAQARGFLEELGAEPVAYPNTAMAAKYVADTGDRTRGAIGARENAQLYGLKVLSTHIMENTNNTTRFLVVGRQPAREGSRFSMIVTVKNEVGALGRIIETISGAGMDMCSIQSRPRRPYPFEYYFYIELADFRDPAQIDALLEDLKSVCERIQPLGVYDRQGAAGSQEEKEIS
ncbi:bifunctional chorismate mutase/prephenate dehydratase [uncultured Faecalibaculum sp.]|uniref:bifunctional chorismate mutase/prephenate dehydratase n=1 Tax=uncultured Faecalibaculum sp. TaxID=1729681 RepID=UPI0025F60EB2|nr:prephenate dehydratase domain-containing protein [uncultured Faecalibaculum sp.]